MHLIAGLSAGVVIFIMCVTGALLAFEKNIIEIAERDIRYSRSNSATPPLPISEILSRVQESDTEIKPSSIMMTNQPRASWRIGLGRDVTLYVDPYTGEIMGSSNRTVTEAMSRLREWQRWLALSGEQRHAGRAITGASNMFFLFLALSGIYIWMPSKFNRGLIKPVLWFRGGLRGKARNFNWHSTIGFWTSLFLMAIMLKATVISYQ